MCFSYFETVHCMLVIIYITKHWFWLSCIFSIWVIDLPKQKCSIKQKMATINTILDCSILKIIYWNPQKTWGELLMFVVCHGRRLSKLFSGHIILKVYKILGQKLLFYMHYTLAVINSLQDLCIINKTVNIIYNWPSNWCSYLLTKSSQFFAPETMV